MKRVNPHPYLAMLGARLAGDPDCFAISPASSNDETSTGPFGGSFSKSSQESAPAGPCADDLAQGPALSQGGEAASRLVHTQETAGASPAPATSSCLTARTGSSASCASDGAFAEANDARPGLRASPGAGGAVALSDASAFILRLIAAHEGRPESDVLALLIAGAAEAIGIHPLIMRDAGLAGLAGEAGDLTDLPDHARRAGNRFKRL